MPYHLLITDSSHRGRRLISFDHTGEWIEKRVVGPWERGEDIVLQGQHWNPREVRVTIIEGNEAGGAPGSLEKWNAIRPTCVERTDEFLQAPAGSAAAGEAVTQAADQRAVMVVHGRDDAARDAMFQFLRAIDLRPMEWTELVGAVNSAAPYIGDVLDQAFAGAQAAVVLLTPDDVASLRLDLVPEGDPEGDAEPRGQPRPNVFYEAGMAMGRFPERTVLAELGTMRPASDLLGRHAVRLGPGPECRRDLAQRLEGAGCAVNTDGTDWLTAGDFVAPEVPAAAATSALQDARQVLRERVDALLGDVQGGQGRVPWSVAEIYNALVVEAGVEGLPRAERRRQTGADQLRGSSQAWASMRYDELRAHLSQLRAQL